MTYLVSFPLFNSWVSLAQKNTEKTIRTFDTAITSHWSEDLKKRRKVFQNNSLYIFSLKPQLAKAIIHSERQL